MYLEKLEINKFRNYEHLYVELSKSINIIYGNNAQGKTNLLESIYVLGLTKSHRSFIDNNLINKDSNFARIKGLLNIDDYKSTLEIIIQKTSKKLKIDNFDIKRVSDYISNLNIIIFYPEDLKIIKDSPGERRKYLNTELSQMYSNYYNSLNEYNKLLKMRNDYLKKVNENTLDKEYLLIITNYLIDKAILIYRMRYQFLKEINNYCSGIFKNITGLDGFKLVYKPNIDLENNNFKEQLIEKFTKLLNTEIKLGNTLIGPHRDDFEFCLGDINLKNYGSQGQQRLSILTLKLAEIEVFKKNKGYYPILLLDDVFSELDEVKKNNLLNYINNDIQTIITTTDLNLINKDIIDRSKLFYIENGNLIESKEV